MNGNQIYMDWVAFDGPQPWPLPDPIQWMPDEAHYHGEILTELCQLVSGYKIYWTYNPLTVPEVGPDVIIFLRESWNNVPLYQGQVAHVIHSGSYKPYFGFNTVFPLSRRKIAHAVPFARKLIRNAGRAMQARLKAKFGRLATITEVPLGPMLHDPNRPMKPFWDRGHDIQFAGSMDITPPTLKYSKQIEKDWARHGMATALKGVIEGGKYNVDYRPTGKFMANAYESHDAYLAALMDTRICLAPRGTYPDTYRHFEAWRAGCITIGDPQAPTWWMEKSPSIELEDWAALPETLDQVLGDRQRAEALHRETLAWYERQVSPRAVAAHLAKRIPVRPGEMAEIILRKQPFKVL